jgi:hypothetical protein
MIVNYMLMALMFGLFEDTGIDLKTVIHNSMLNKDFAQ